MKTKFALIFGILLNGYKFVNPTPQLNLPPLPPASSARPDVIHNSFPERDRENSDKNVEANNYDQDRSNRYGPPYFDNEDDEENDDIGRRPRYRINDDRNDRVYYISLIFNE